MIYSNVDPLATGGHGVFRSSRLKSSETGHIYDLIVRDSENKNIAIDNGVAVKVGNPTGDGLQTRYATVATTKDKVAIIGTPALVKDAFTRFQADERNFFVPAGQPAKAYEVLPEEGEVFGIGEFQFSTIADTNAVQFGNYVVVDGAGKWVELASAPTTGTYGFVGKVYGFEESDSVRIVLVECLENKDIA